MARVLSLAVESLRERRSRQTPSGERLRGRFPPCRHHLGVWSVLCASRKRKSPRTLNNDRALMENFSDWRHILTQGTLSVNPAAGKEGGRVSIPSQAARRRAAPLGADYSPGRWPGSLTRYVSVSLHHVEQRFRVTLPLHTGGSETRPPVCARGRGLTSGRPLEAS